jgi:RNA polymerase sigma-70 factor (ECF subfamily)
MTAQTRLAAVVEASRVAVVAILAGDLRDLVDAEDAFADAVVEALESWPRQGIPDRPEGWLLTVARRRALDRRRGERRAAATAAELLRRGPPEAADSGPLPDRRLAMLGVCAHPGIDPAVRAPLMLQTVLGLDAARIAGTFLVPPATMAQRLVRAKRRIAEEAIPFTVPDAGTWAERRDDVLAAIYAAFTAGDDDDGGPWRTTRCGSPGSPPTRRRPTRKPWACSRCCS